MCCFCGGFPEIVEGRGAKKRGARRAFGAILATVTTRWLNPTGGLRYHGRAWRYRSGLWAPFTSAVARFLSRWSPPERELILVGPSGGYCLDLSFLSRFVTVTALEVDPIARWIFARRARSALRSSGTALRWEPEDRLSPRDGAGFTLEPLRALLAANPDAAVLFCNVLGQLPLLGPDLADDVIPEPTEGSFERWLLELPEALAGHSWASFHDRLSGPLRPEGIDPDALVPWRSSEDLAAELYAPTDEPERTHGEGVELALNDHRTSLLARERPRYELVWELEPAVFHLVEAISSRRS